MCTGLDEGGSKVSSSSIIDGVRQMLNEKCVWMLCWVAACFW